MTLQQIKIEVENATGIKNFTQKGRKRIELIPRMIFCQLALDYSNAGVTEIGKFINRDHATVIHYQKNFRYVLSKEQKESYNELRDKITRENNQAAKKAVIMWFNTLPEEKYTKVLKRIKTLHI